MAPITLVTSNINSVHLDSLPYERLSLLQVFRSGSFAAKSPAIESKTSMAHVSQPHSSEPQAGEKMLTPIFDEENVPIPGKASSGGSFTTRSEAINNWRDASNFAGASAIPSPVANPSQNSAKLQSRIWLNINDERVDPPPEEENPDVKSQMQARMKEKKYCTFFHLFDSCSSAETCKFRHEPMLDTEELVILRNTTKRLPCGFGSKCRVAACRYGHTCQYQPRCRYGSDCRLAKFHGVDKTRIRALTGSSATPLNGISWE